MDPPANAPASESAASRLIVLSDPACLNHDPGLEHPEHPGRLQAILSELAVLPAGASWRMNAPLATRQQLLAVHHATYVDAVLSYRGRSGSLDHETLLSPGSVDAALHAAGASCLMVDLLVAGICDSVFALVRPPGHHALADRAMGYCIFNNVAIATALARAHDLNVLIVDWDVHHGNGTQASFAADPGVAFVSIHERGLFPTDSGDDSSAPSATRAQLVNLPMPAGSGDDDYLFALQAVLPPLAARFRPQLVLVSAGYDAHRDDPMSSMQLTSAGYAALTALVMAIAKKYAGGRLGLVLEGGYDNAALASAVRATIEVLAGQAPGHAAQARAPIPSAEVLTSVGRISRQLA